MKYNSLKLKTVKFFCSALLALGGLVLSGCANYHAKLTPEYDLPANQDKKILVWVESPRSAYADVDAPGTLATSIGNYLVTQAKVKPDNVIIHHDESNYVSETAQSQSPEEAARQAGAELALVVQIQEYELQPMRIQNLHYGRMLTRALLLDVRTWHPLWPSDGRGKVHDIIVELGDGDRDQILLRLADSTAHCISRNLYPIAKAQYRNSDERVSFQETFELETF